MGTLPALARAVAAVVLVQGLTHAAHAQVDSREAIALQNQILELRHEIDQLRVSGGSGSREPPPPPAESSRSGGDLDAQLLGRVTELEDQVRSLRGRLDESENARQRQGADLSKQIGDLEFRLQNAPPAPSAAPRSPPPTTLGGPPASPAAPASPPRRTPERALQEGNAALGRRDYVAAEGAAREVLVAGHGPRTTDAQYLLAQALAGQRNYQGAAVAYDDAYTRNAKGNRAPDSLLGLTNSLTALGDKKAACQTLEKLRVEFPSPRSDLRDQVSAARTRAACR